MDSPVIVAIDRMIAKAAKFEIELTRNDFDWTVEEGLTIDGMSASDWLDAMTLD